MIMIKEMKYTDEYIVNILKEIGWEERNYPLTDMGIYMFLRSKGINILIYHPVFDINQEYWVWSGVKEDYDLFSEDFSEYKEFNDAVNAAFCESICYLSLEKIK